MPVPSTLAELSVNASENSPLGSESPTTADNYFRAHAAFIKQVDEKADAALGGASSIGIDLAEPTGAALVGSDDGAGGSLWSTVAGFLTHLKSTAGAAIAGFSWGALPTAINKVDWGIQTAGDGVSLLRYIPPAEWAAIQNGTSSYDCASAIAGWLAGAFASPHKKALYIPAGKYLTSQKVNVSYPTVSIKGAERYSSVIKFTGAGVAFHCSDANPNNGSFTFGGEYESFCIEGNANATSLFYVENVNHIKLKNINLREASTAVGVGLHILGTVLGYFENVYCSTNAQLMTSRPQNGIIVDRDPGTLQRATANTFLHCVVEGTIGDGIQLLNSDQSLFLGGTSENNDGNGVTIVAGSRMNTFISVAFENSSASTFADIYDNGFSNKFINCYSKKLVYIDTASQFSKVSGGFHQSITVAGDFATLESLKYSFFGPGGVITTNASTDTKELFNVQTGGLTFAVKSPVVVTVGASPFTYTNGSGKFESVIVQGGTVSQIVLDRFGPIINLPTDGMFELAPTDSITITHSAAPTMVRLPRGSGEL